MIDMENIGPRDIGARLRVTHQLGVTEGPLTRIVKDTGAVKDSALYQAEPSYTAGATTVTLTVGGQEFAFEQTGHGYRGPDVERVGA